MESEGETSVLVAVVTEPRFTQRYRDYLQKEKLLDRRHRVEKLRDGLVALPVLAETLPEEHLQELRNRVAPGSTCKLTQLLHPLPSKRALVCPPAQRLCVEVRRWVEDRGVTWSPELEADLPRSWQRHGDLMLLGEDCFQAEQWKSLEPGLWETVASALGVQRLAKRGRVLPDGTRTPSVTLLLGDHGRVEHMDNGIRYTFDVTQCMFSFGNITEKLRVASLSCAGEVLVDLYAGIGYFTLPFLVHAGAAFVHACEWNPHAVVALRNNLEINGVADRCQIHFGDNRKLQLSNTADRVNLGLIPSSEEGWPMACQVLRNDVGGILHIHQNVESFSGKTPQPLGSSNRGKAHWLHPPQIITHQWGNGTTGGARGEMQSITSKPEWQSWAESAETQSTSKPEWQRWAGSAGTQSTSKPEWQSWAGSAGTQSTSKPEWQRWAESAGTQSTSKPEWQSWAESAGTQSTSKPEWQSWAEAAGTQSTSKPEWQRWAGSAGTQSTSKPEWQRWAESAGTQSTSKPEWQRWAGSAGTQSTSKPEWQRWAGSAGTQSTSKPEWQRWAEAAGTRIASLLHQMHGKPWRTRILHVHPVKSYAPHVDHIVLDLECRPCPLVG